MDSRPIGIMDSGFGGVSTLKQAVKLLPTENFVYFGDNANAPYGNRSVREERNLENNSGMSQIKFITSGDLERETIIYNRLLAE